MVPVLHAGTPHRVSLRGFERSRPQLVCVLIILLHGRYTFRCSGAIKPPGSGTTQSGTGQLHRTGAWRKARAREIAVGRLVQLLRVDDLVLDCAHHLEAILVVDVAWGGTQRAATATAFGKGAIGSTPSFALSFSKVGSRQSSA